MEQVLSIFEQENWPEIQGAQIAKEGPGQRIGELLIR